MFDVGLSELALIGLIALIVLGPERLPEAARTVGKWVARGRRFVRSVTDELEREAEVKEFREGWENTRRSFQDEWSDLSDATRGDAKSSGKHADKAEKREHAAAAASEDADTEAGDRNAVDRDAPDGTVAHEERAADEAPKNDAGATTEEAETPERSAREHERNL